MRPLCLDAKGRPRQGVALRSVPDEVLNPPFTHSLVCEREQRFRGPGDPRGQRRLQTSPGVRSRKGGDGHPQSDRKLCGIRNIKGGALGECFVNLEKWGGQTAWSGRLACGWPHHNGTRPQLPSVTKDSLVPSHKALRNWQTLHDGCPTASQKRLSWPALRFAGACGEMSMENTGRGAIPSL